MRCRSEAEHAYDLGGVIEEAGAVEEVGEEGLLLMDVSPIILLMNELHQTALEDLQLCHCHLCLFRKEPPRVDLHSDVGTENSLAEFIKMLPVGFPLIVEQTVILHRRDGQLEYHSYLNPPEERKKYSVVHQTLRGLSSLPCQNVQLYSRNS